MGRGKTGNFWKAAAILLGCALLTGCGNTGEVDDYATNIGYEARGSNGTTQVVQSESGSSATTQTAGIPKEEIKVGVLHLSDPAEGSGYTYTHDLGIQGMQQNLGLSDDQIIRKINVNDGDAGETRQAIQECIDEGCNIIFTTSWGYMETTAEMAEEYPEVYFSHGTGYLSNGKNFNNYFGRIYQARYLSGIVAGMNTSSNKIGYGFFQFGGHWWYRCLCTGNLFGESGRKSICKGDKQLVRSRGRKSCGTDVTGYGL